MPKSIFSPEYNKLRQLLIAARQAKNLTQNQVAIRLGKPQSFISKYERGERRLDIIEFLHVTDALEISPLAMVMQLQPELARDDRPKDILEEWAMTSQDLTTLLNQNPSLRGMLFGYTAEFKLEEIWLKESEITFCYKDDDHDRTKKGDRRIIYKDQTFIIEAKSVQTNSIKYDAGRWVGKTQVDASDRRKIVLPNGDTVNTTLLQVGEFDVLAVNVYSFEKDWRFVFAKNRDLPRTRYKKYTIEQQQYLLASLIPVTWPPEPPFTDNLYALLDDLILEQD